VKHLRLAAVALIAPLVLGTTACSAERKDPEVASVKPAGKPEPKEDTEDSIVPWVKCMREQGMDVDDNGEFPSNPDGSTDLPDGFTEANEACESVAPVGRTPESTEDEQESMIKLATCMRDNGVSDWPDPLAPGQQPKNNGSGGMVSSGGGGFDLPASIDLSSPKVKKALDECMGGAGIDSSSSGVVQ